MKILLISPYIPYPPITGGKVRVYNFIQKLKKDHEIVIICLLKNPEEMEDIETIRKMGFHVYPILRRKAWSIENLFRTLFSRYPFLTVVNNFSEETENLILEVIEKEKPDLIHLETFYMAQSLLAVKDKIKIPLFLAKVDVEAQVYFRNAAQKKNPILKFLGHLDARKMLNYEVEVTKYFNKVSFASEVDRKLLKLHMAKKHIKVATDLVPNGVDTKHYRPEPKTVKYTDPTLVFLGNFRYFANTDAAFYFVREVWPKILEKMPNTKLIVMGPLLQKGIQQFLSNDMTKLSSDSITITGFVEEDDKINILSKAWISIAPIRVGSGTKLKILESMAIGTPVVATSVGIEGIDVEYDKDVIIKDTPTDLADAIVKLLNDPKKRASISRNARKVVESVYDWDVITNKLDIIYKQLIKKGR